MYPPPSRWLLALRLILDPFVDMMVYVGTVRSACVFFRSFDVVLDMRHVWYVCMYVFVFGAFFAVRCFLSKEGEFYFALITRVLHEQDATSRMVLTTHKWRAVNEAHMNQDDADD